MDEQGNNPERGSTCVCEGENRGCSAMANGGEEVRSVVARYSIDAPGYRAIADALWDGKIVLEGEEACDPETAALMFVMSGTDSAEFEDRLQRSDAITDIQRWGEQTEGQTRYYVRLPIMNTAYWERTRQGGMVLGGGVRTGEWVVSVRFPNREALIDFRKECETQGLGFTLKALTRGDNSLEGNSSSVTDAQQSLLQMAIEEGYFCVPREISLTELAQRLEISNQAASERLRRGLTNYLDVEE